MTSKEKLKQTCEILDKMLPKDISFIVDEIPWHFTLLVILSARCTDKKVMGVREELFSSFPTLEDFREERLLELEQILKPLGLYKAKARNLIDTATSIRENYEGKVPNNMEDLLKLKGIGRKCANCILGQVYGKPAVICDTHFTRLNYRLGIVDKQDPAKLERIVRKNLEEEFLFRYSMAGNLYAREICSYSKPNCKKCSLSFLCDFFSKS